MNGGGLGAGKNAGEPKIAMRMGVEGRRIEEKHERGSCNQRTEGVMK